jgi:hypothetical protein
LLPGVDPDALKAYGNTIEEARADLFGLYYIADPKLPLPIRKVLNTALDIHKINGKVYTADEITRDFSSYGFHKLYDKHDAYAQLVCLERE